ncbi:hypothetical protein SFR_1048 [Streptomyces sp. FR-008]|nr:hypothetical protein SFR_1048 [Streptomyces sp. FR-008]
MVEAGRRHHLGHQPFGGHLRLTGAQGERRGLVAARRGRGGR